jgi:UPF0716 protein FxsA
MSLVKWAFIALLALPAAEIVVFFVVAAAIGWLWTIFLFFGSSLVGMMVLKHAGRANLTRFRSALAGQGAAAIHLDAPGLATMIGGFLLVVPGFITDAAAVLLLLPPLRRWLGATIGRAVRKARPRPPRSPAVIDLEPDQWHQVPDRRPDGRGGHEPRP